jgi:gluconate 2-dehydrogenase gamma chain
MQQLQCFAALFEVAIIGPRSREGETVTDDPEHAGRRAFLRNAASLAPLAALGGAAAASSVAPPSATPASNDYAPTFFTPAEWAFLNAACARLIPNDDNGPGAIELGVPQYIDRQMGTPWAEGGLWYMQGPFVEAKAEFGYQSALTPKQQYRLGIKAIDEAVQAAAGKKFAALPQTEQDDWLKKIEKGDVTSPDLPLKTFFTSFLLKNTLEGYFGDPLYGGNKDMTAWKMIGHPGARADFLEFVAEAKPYPYGPVSLHGKRG